MRIAAREAVEFREAETLADDACLARDTDGRARSSSPDTLRTEFTRDRDKIIHSKAFRRLSHKTQVFIAPTGDHYRTRLTHTLEVSQIARTIARGLSLNEDLTEAIALGHDLGHTPFGHTGEAAIRSCLSRHLSNSSAIDGARLFNHNQQSLRVVEVIENNGRGLNLTSEVKDGIVCHTGRQDAETLEGRIVAIADRIAYVNHDIDDAIRAGILEEDQIPESTHVHLGEDHSTRIETLVTDAVRTSAQRGDIELSQVTWDTMMELRTFLFDRVYRSESVMFEVRKAQHLIEMLFDYYLDHIDAVPQEYRDISRGDTIRAVCDYVAGMTDRYALDAFADLFMPHSFTGIGAHI